MTSPKLIVFHNPMKHPAFDKDGLPTGTKDAVKLAFKMPTNEVGTFDEYEVEPGEEIQVREEMAYGVKHYAPQMVEGPSPKKKDEPKAAKADAPKY